MQQIKKTISAAVFILVTIFIISCSKSNSLTNTSDALPGLAGETAGKSAEAKQSQQTWLIDETVFISCANNGAGEYVNLYGYMHLNYQFSGNDNHFTLVTTMNPNEVTGTGLSTGDKYVATGTAQQIITGSILNGQFHANGASRFRFVGQGTGNNSYLSFSGHVTVNANGEVINELLNISSSCQ
jgi:hypothetical protein